MQRFDGRYRVLEPLGVGGMATVYRARDERLKRDVAVKVIADHLASDPAFVQQFRREAKIGAHLSHPNVVAVLDAGQVPRDFIVMEIVAGVDAGAFVQTPRGLTADQALHVVMQVCHALAHAHARGVVHEDVAPRNILISEPSCTATLIDFGVSSRSRGPCADLTLDLSGTPGYVAPEVIRGAPPSPRSDLYSLGMVAYRLLAGPSVARTEAVPQAVQRAVARDPDLRQRSVAEFGAELVTQQGARREGPRADRPTRTSSARAA